MCVIKDKYTKAKQFTGYKVALKDRETGEYYSPYTGSVYREGRRMRPRKTYSYGGSSPVALNNSDGAILFEPKMQGKTGVFRFFLDATRLRDRFSPPEKYEVVILKMTIKGALYNATMSLRGLLFGDTVIGSHIVAIEEVRQ